MQGGGTRQLDTMSLVGEQIGIILSEDDYYNYDDHLGGLQSTGGTVTRTWNNRGVWIGQDVYGGKKTRDEVI